MTLKKFQKVAAARKNSNEWKEAYDYVSRKEEKLNDDEMDNELQELITKYHLYELRDEYIKQARRLSDVSTGQRHTTIESFAFIPFDIPRLLIIGESGIGKSSLCNKMAGVYYKLVPDDSDSSSSSSDGDDVNKKKQKKPRSQITTIQEGQNEIFRSGDECGITQATSWAQVS